MCSTCGCRIFENSDPFMPWNSAMEREDPFKPWNSEMYKNDPFAPWNSSLGNKRDYERYCNQHHIPKYSR